MNSKFGLLRATTVLALVVSLPVAAAVPAGRYTFPTAGTVYDTMTKLTWQQTVPPATYSWADAKTYCMGVGATLGGSGWRLPTAKELQTIVDESRFKPAINPTAFPATPTDSYWSSTPYGTAGDMAWRVIFDYGVSNGNFATFVYSVRCVR